MTFTNILTRETYFWSRYRWERFLFRPPLIETKDCKFLKDKLYKEMKSNGYTILFKIYKLMWNNDSNNIENAGEQKTQWHWNTQISLEYIRSLHWMVAVFKLCMTLIRAMKRMQSLDMCFRDIIFRLTCSCMCVWVWACSRTRIAYCYVCLSQSQMKCMQYVNT